MPIIFIYLLKLSVSLGVMYLFYQFLLRRLTFYNHNRWYLIGYSLLSFFIPLINISDVLQKNEMVNTGIVTIVPAVETFTAKMPPYAAIADALGRWTIWSWLMTILVVGITILLLRLVVQFFSFLKIKSRAKLITDDEIKFYQVDKNIIPFSFGNSIFINQHLHTEEELKEIVLHEFVHIKQKHTVDIIFSELLCILNWYNPFAWLIRKAIRQNLEFIADNKVLENGMDKKQYQYLLLKVIGNNHFSIASQFNFSSLKKRIAMMNKMKTARVHILRFFFMLPLIAIAVLAFRKEEQPLKYAVIVYDAETLKPIPNVRVKGIYTNVEYTTDAKGYIEIPASADKENKMHISYDFIKEGYIKWWNRKFETDFKNNKPNSVIELISLKKGADNGFCDICGAASQSYDSRGLSLEEDAWQFFNLLMKVKKKQVIITATISNISLIDTIPAVADEKKDSLLSEFLKRNTDVKDVGWVYDNFISNKVVQIHIIKKTGANEVYDVNDKTAMLEFEKKYRKLPASPQREALSNGIDKSVLVAADTVIWKSKKGNLYFAGDVKIEDTKGKITFEAKGIYRDKSNMQLIFLNGNELDFGNTNLVLKGKYQITSLSNEEALRKYGDKGKYGVIEIKSIPSSEINFIEKRNIPAWDIKNVLPGKKKDEC